MGFFLIAVQKHLEENDQKNFWEFCVISNSIKYNSNSLEEPSYPSVTISWAFCLWFESCPEADANVATYNDL